MCNEQVPEPAAFSSQPLLSSTCVAARPRPVKNDPCRALASVLVFPTSYTLNGSGSQRTVQEHSRCLKHKAKVAPEKASVSGGLGRATSTRALLHRQESQFLTWVTPVHPQEERRHLEGSFPHGCRSWQWVAQMPHARECNRYFWVKAVILQSLWKAEPQGRTDWTSKSDWSVYMHNILMDSDWSLWPWPPIRKGWIISDNITEPV